MAEPAKPKKGDGETRSSMGGETNLRLAKPGDWWGKPGDWWRNRPLQFQAFFPPCQFGAQPAGGYHLPRGSLPFVRNRNDQVGCFSAGTNKGSPHPSGPLWQDQGLGFGAPSPALFWFPLLQQGLPISLASPCSASFK